MLKNKIGLIFVFFFLLMTTAFTQDTVWLNTGELYLYNTHTNETMRLRYLNDEGQVTDEAVQQLSYFLRSPGTNEVKTIDPHLCVTLGRIQDYFGPEKQIQIISGYRSPYYNNKLRAQTDGVAKGSYHLQAKAADISIPGVKLSEIYAYTKAIQQGGAGYYPGRFVHVDVGPVRCW